MWEQFLVTSSQAVGQYPIPRETPDSGSQQCHGTTLICPNRKLKVYNLFKGKGINEKGLPSKKF